MNKIKRILALFLAAFMIAGILPISASAAAEGYSADGKWFNWGAGADGKDHGILLLYNYPNKITDITLYYKDGEFFCDPACEVRCVALGVDRRGDGAISWKSFGRGYVNPEWVDESDRQYSHSVGDISELLEKFYRAWQSLLWEEGGDRIENSCSDYTINIVMNSTYDVSFNEYDYWDYTDSTQQIHTVIWGDSMAASMSDTRYTQRFHGQLNLIRGDNLTGTMVNVVGALGKRTHFAPGVNVTFDNRTTSNDDVAVRIGFNTLFQFENASIINSLSTPENRYGIGVLLDGDDPMAENNGAIELGTDVGGSCQINGCNIAIKMYSGVTRFKVAAIGNPYSLAGNNVGIDMFRGTYIAKWTEDISMLDSQNVLITVEDPDSWKAGDTIFTSGKSRINSSGVSVGEHDTPLLESDLSVVEFAYAGDLFNVFALKFNTDNSAMPDNLKYLYPQFQLAGGCILNERTGRWHTTLNNALNDTALQDGDVLVYFDNVNEQRAVTVNKNVTIRSARPGETRDDKTGGTGGYAAIWYNTSGAESFITVAPGKTLTLGGTDSGAFTLDCNGMGRAVEVSEGAVLNLNSNAHIMGGDGTNGTAVYQNGTMNISGNFSLEDNSVYLPEGKVITKAGAFTNAIHVALADIDNGTDILVSGGAVVADTDNALIVWDNSVSTYIKTYDEDGCDNAGTANKNVVEIQIKKFSVTYKDGAEGTVFTDKTFNVDYGADTPYPFTQNPERAGYTFAGWDPAVSATVTGDAVYTAQWKTVFYICHSSDPSVLEEVELEDDTFAFDITAKVYDNCLYGGLATDITFAEADEENCGVELYPEPGDVFFLREVSDMFLRPKILSVKKSSGTAHKDIQHFLITAIDADGVAGGFYTGYGFMMDRADPTGSTLEGYADPYADEEEDLGLSSYALYESVSVYKPNNVTYRTETPASLFGGVVTNNDYIGAVPFEAHFMYDTLAEYYVAFDEETGEKETFAYSPYYVTADSVIVTGVIERTVDMTDLSSTAPDNTDVELGSSTYSLYGGIVVESVLPPLMVFSVFTAEPVEIPEKIDVVPEPVVPEISKPVITTVFQGQESRITVEPGNYVDKLTIPEFDGLRFAGWFADAAYTVPADLSNVEADMTIYGKYIHEAYFQVKTIQTVSKNVLTNLRMVTVLDSTVYTEYGMEIRINGSTTVYKASKTYSAVSGLKAQKIFGNDVEKTSMMVYQDVKTKGMAEGTEIVVTPYYITQDGSRVYGESKTMIYRNGSVTMQ